MQYSLETGIVIRIKLNRTVLDNCLHANSNIIIVC